jgi:PQQ-dependent dehydrogenase (methanol/ethanol family)
MNGHFRSSQASQAKVCIVLLFGAFFAVCAAISSSAYADPAQRIVNADSEPGNWLTYGRTYSEQHFSPLAQIDTTNISQLGLAWSYDIDEVRPVEAMPLVVDGVMYVTAPWSKVYALDAATGKELWRYDPEVPKSFEPTDCCRSVNRGVAYWNGKVYVGALDGRLIAIDAKTGKRIWETPTVDGSWPYAITGAPRVIKGKVIIGNGGADLGVRGYVGAYDAETGQKLWRFYTVPGNPAKGFENDAMRMAAKTWTGQWWKYGGGGTVWDSMVYDPDLDLLYIGTGNGSPWDRHVRSPGGGDNLFLASIVALRPDTGAYVWHYQTAPGEMWDYTATQPMILADLKIDGVLRKVLMQAPKNGIFYVLDRTNGKVISARNYVPTNWTSGVDLKSGRPSDNPAARYPDGKLAVVQPGSSGGHNWPPIAFSPATGLVYFTARVNSACYGDDPADVPAFVKGSYVNTAFQPCLAQPEADPALPVAPPSAARVAWDPVAQKPAWRVPIKGFLDSGVLATAGDLIVLGGMDGHVTAYDAKDGKVLWSFAIDNTAVAAPVTYTVNGEQYIAIAAGAGYETMLHGPLPYPAALPNTNRVLAFRLNGKAVLPAVAYEPQTIPKAPPLTADPKTLEAARHVFNRYCFACHGVDATSDRIRPDLRYSNVLGSQADWTAIVVDGARKDAGMGNFGKVVSPEMAEAMRQFVIAQAHIAESKMAGAPPDLGPAQ